MRADAKSSRGENEQVNRAGGASTRGPAGLGGAFEPGAINKGQGDIVENGHDVNGVASAKTAKIFMQGAIAALMGAAFDTPMMTDGVEQDIRRGLGFGQTCDAVGDKDGLVAGFLKDGTHPISCFELGRFVLAT